VLVSSLVSTAQHVRRITAVVSTSA